MRRLESDWRRLVAETPDRRPQHAYESHAAYLSHFSAADEGIRCLALSDGERIRAICPTTSGSVRLLGRSVACVGLLCWKGGLLLDVICPPGEAQRELLPRVVDHLHSVPSRPDWLVFDRVLEGSTLWRCLQDLDQRRVCRRDAAPTDVVSCARPYEEYFAGLSKNFRGNLRKARNKLAQLAGVHFAIADRAPELRRAFEAFVELEASGWKGEAGERSAMRFRPDQLAYHGELTGRRWEGGACEIHSLHAEGACLASVLCLVVGSEFEIARIAYDERYSRCAPGQLLVEKVLQRCCENPAIERVNLASDAAWHRDWHPEPIRSHSVYVGLGQRSGLVRARFLREWSRYVPRLRGALERSGLGERLARRRGNRGRED